MEEEYITNIEIRIAISTNKSIYDEEFDDIEDADEFYHQVMKKIEESD